MSCMSLDKIGMDAMNNLRKSISDDTPMCSMQNMLLFSFRAYDKFGGGGVRGRKSDKIYIYDTFNLF